MENENGQEVPNRTPVPLPPGYSSVLNRFDDIKAFIRSEVSRIAADEGAETFEEADDFDVDEDPDPLSQYELQDAAPEWPGGVKDVDPDGPGTPPHGQGGNDPTGSVRGSGEVRQRASETVASGGSGDGGSPPPVAVSARQG